MDKSEALLFKLNTFIAQLNAVEKSKLSPTLQNYLSFFIEIQSYIAERTKLPHIDKSLVQKSDVIDVIENLKFSFYNFFPTIKDDAVDKMVNVWYGYLKKYKKVVLQDAVGLIITTQNDYGKAPNLPDVICKCDSLKYDNKYK